MDQDILLACRDASLGYEHRALLEHLTFTVRAGDYLCVVGENGSGKSTLMKSLLGLLPPLAGTIDCPAQRAGAIGYLPQQTSAQRDFPATVSEVVLSGFANKRGLHFFYSAAEKSAALMNMGKLGVLELQNRCYRELSGGQQQRVAIARTLAPSPKVLFMDEPLSNLDAKLRQEMRAELKRLHSDTNSTFVYVTHDQLEAMTLSTRVCLMENGLLQQYDPPLTVYNRPANKFVASFVGNPTMNFIPAKKLGTDGKGLKLSIFDETVHFTGKEAVESCPDNVIIGVRPEFMPITEKGPIKGKIYSTLPTGMETTVQVMCDGTMLTAVVFGSVDFPIDSAVELDLTGDCLALFDAETGKALGYGSVIFQ